MHLDILVAILNYCFQGSERDTRYITRNIESRSQNIMLTRIVKCKYKTHPQSYVYFDLYLLTCGSLAP